MHEGSYELPTLVMMDCHVNELNQSGNQNMIYKLNTRNFAFN